MTSFTLAWLVALALVDVLGSLISNTDDVNTMSEHTKAHTLMLVFLLHVGAAEVAGTVAEAT